MLSTFDRSWKDAGAGMGQVESSFRQGVFYVQDDTWHRYRAIRSFKSVLRGMDKGKCDDGVVYGSARGEACIVLSKLLKNYGVTEQARISNNLLSKKYAKRAYQWGMRGIEDVCWGILVSKRLLKNGDIK